MTSDKHPETDTLLQSLRVLYVEDDPDTLRELSRFLKKRVGFVATAGNGTEALESASNCPFDVIITDLRMPGMDGFSFVRTLRDRGCRCPVIITSAFSDSDTIIQAVDLGIVKYCIKPLNTAELILTLEKLATEQLAHAGSLAAEKGFDRQQKLAFEKKIRSDWAHLLKTVTGKGPKEVQVVLGIRTLQVSITEAFTPLELTLLKNPANAGLVIYLRKALYTEIRAALEETVAATLETESRLTDIVIDPASQTDRITLRF